MRVFLDTNVILDYLHAREPFARDAVILMELCKNSIFQGIVSSLTIVNCFYILRKAYPIDVVYEKVNWLLKTFEISSINHDVIQKAYLSKRRDFEDMVQYYSACNSKSDVIITRDKDGFSECDINVMNVKEFIDACMQR